MIFLRSTRSKTSLSTQDLSLGVLLQHTVCSILVLVGLRLLLVHGDLLFALIPAAVPQVVIHCSKKSPVRPSTHSGTSTFILPKLLVISLRYCTHGRVVQMTCLCTMPVVRSFQLSLFSDLLELEQLPDVCLAFTRKPQHRCSCPLTRIRKLFQIQCPMVFVAHMHLPEK